MRLFPARPRLRTAELLALIEKVETARRLAGCSFGVSGVPLWDKLKALPHLATTPTRSQARERQGERVRTRRSVIDEARS